MNTNSPNRKSWSSRIVTVGVIIAMLVSMYSLFKVVTLQPGEKAIVAPGVTVEKTKRNVADFYIRDGQLVVAYSDGSTNTLGEYRGRDGANGKDAVISSVDVSNAVNKYCQGGRCDAKNPTPSVVLASVLESCGGSCRGADGKDGKDAQPATPDQILAQVANFCGDGRCKGEVGATGAAGVNGANGADGRTQHLACVLVKENNTDVRYYSAKYTDEPDTAYLTWQYRSKLPTWFQPNDCIDMRSV